MLVGFNHLNGTQRPSWGTPRTRLPGLRSGCALQPAQPPSGCDAQALRIRQRGQSFTLMLQLSSSSMFSSFKSRWTTPF